MGPGREGSLGSRSHGGAWALAASVSHRVVRGHCRQGESPGCPLGSCEDQSTGALQIHPNDCAGPGLRAHTRAEACLKLVVMLNRR